MKKLVLSATLATLAVVAFGNSASAGWGFGRFRVSIEEGPYAGAYDVYAGRGGLYINPAQQQSQSYGPGYTYNYDSNYSGLNAPSQMVVVSAGQVKVQVDPLPVNPVNPVVRPTPAPRLLPQVNPTPIVRRDNRRPSDGGNQTITPGSPGSGGNIFDLRGSNPDGGNNNFVRAPNFPVDGGNRAVVPRNGTRPDFAPTSGGNQFDLRGSNPSSGGSTTFARTPFIPSNGGNRTVTRTPADGGNDFELRSVGP